MTPLKLVAFDEEDLAVLSAHLQDAVLQVGDVIWQPAEKRLVLAINRFDWEAAQDGAPRFLRRRAALRFERVLSFQSRGVSVDDKGVVLNLLALTFDDADPPSGAVMLTFSGGGAFLLRVECLEAELADLGPVWATSCCPAHADEPQTA